MHPLRRNLETIRERGKYVHRGRRVLSVLLGVGLLVALFLIAGRESIEIVAAPSLAELSGVLAMLVVLMAVSTHRWKILTELFLDDYKANFNGYFRSFAVSRAVGLFIPQGIADFGVRPAMQQATHTSSAASAFAGVMLERLMDGTLLLALGVAAAPYLLGWLDNQGFLVLCIIMLGVWTFLFLALTPVSLRIVIKGVDWFTQKYFTDQSRFSSLKVRLDPATQILSDNLTSMGPMRHVAFLSILRLGLILLQLLLLSRALGLTQIGPLILLAAIPLGQLGTLIAITPGGLGFVEGGLLASFYALGVPSNQALAFVLGQRIYLGAFILFVAVLSIVFLPPSRLSRSRD